MCDVIVINKGEKELESIKDFKEHFGCYPEKDKSYKKMLDDCCFCQADLEKTFKKLNIKYHREDEGMDWGDYYINL